MILASISLCPSIELMRCKVSDMALSMENSVFARSVATLTEVWASVAALLALVCSAAGIFVVCSVAGRVGVERFLEVLPWS